MCRETLVGVEETGVELWETYHGNQEWVWKRDTQAEEQHLTGRQNSGGAEQKRTGSDQRFLIEHSQLIRKEVLRAV